MDETVLAITQVMIKLFLILILGFVLNKVGIFDGNTNKKMSELIVKVTAPCLVLTSVLESSADNRMGVLVMLGGGFVMYVCFIIFGKLISLLPFFPKEDKSAYECMCVFSNNAFMGYPVLQAFLGKITIFYAAMINFSFNIFIYTYAVNIFSKSSGKKAVENEEPLWKKVLTPGLILTVISLIVYLSGFRTDGVLYETVSMVGSVTSPLSMLVLGSSLALYPLKKSLLDWRSYIFSAIRLIAIPLISFGICKAIGVDELVSKIILITNAMPVASMVLMIATLYDGSSETVVKNIIVTTMLSVITIPLLVMLVL